MFYKTNYKIDFLKQKQILKQLTMKSQPENNDFFNNEDQTYLSNKISSKKLVYAEELQQIYSNQNLENMLFHRQKHNSMTLQIFQQLKVVQNFNQQYNYQQHLQQENQDRNFIISDKKTKHYQLLQQEQKQTLNQSKHISQQNDLFPKQQPLSSTPHKQQMNKTIQIKKNTQEQYYTAQQHTTKKQIKNSTKTIKIHKSKYIEIQKQLLDRLIKQNDKMRKTIEKLSQITKKLKKSQESNKAQKQHQKGKIQKLTKEIQKRNDKLKQKTSFIEKLNFDIAKLNIKIEALEKYKTEPATTKLEEKIAQIPTIKQLSFVKSVFNEIIDNFQKGNINQTPNHHKQYDNYQMVSQINQLKSSVQQLQLSSNTKKQLISQPKRCYQCERYFQQIRELKLRMIANSNQQLQKQILRLQNLESQHLKSISQLSAKIFKLQSINSKYEQQLLQMQRQNLQLTSLKQSFQFNSFDLDKNLQRQVSQLKEDNKILTQNIINLQDQCEKLFTIKQELQQKLLVIPQLESQSMYFKQRSQQGQAEIQCIKKELINQKVLRNDNQNTLRDNVSLLEEINKELVDKYNSVVMELSKARETIAQVEYINRQNKKNITKYHYDNQQLNLNVQQLMRKLDILQRQKNKQIQNLRDELKQIRKRNRVYSATTNNQSQTAMFYQNYPLDQQCGLQPHNLAFQMDKNNMLSNQQIKINQTKQANMQQQPHQSVKLKLIELQQLNKKLQTQNLHLQQALSIFQQNQPSNRQISGHTFSFDNISTNKQIKLLSEEMMFSKKDIYDSSHYQLESRRIIQSNTLIDQGSMQNIDSQNHIYNKNPLNSQKGVTDVELKQTSSKILQQQVQNQKSQKLILNLPQNNNNNNQNSNNLSYLDTSNLLQQTQRLLLDEKSKRMELQGQIQGMKSTIKQLQEQIYKWVRQNKDNNYLHERIERELNIQIQKYREQILYLCEEKQQLTTCMMKITTQIYQINNDDADSVEERALSNNNIDSVDLSPTLNKGKSLLESLKRISYNSKKIITSMKTINPNNKQHPSNSIIPHHQQYSMNNQISIKQKNCEIQRRQREIQHQLFVQAVNLVEKQILSSRSLNSRTSLNRIQEICQNQAIIDSESSITNVHEIKQENKNIDNIKQSNKEVEIGQQRYRSSNNEDNNDISPIMKQSQVIQKITSSVVSKRNLSMSGQQYHFSLIGMQLNGNNYQGGHQNEFSSDSKILSNKGIDEFSASKGIQSLVNNENSSVLIQRNRELIEKIVILQDDKNKLQSQKMQILQDIKLLPLFKRKQYTLGNSNTYNILNNKDKVDHVQTLQNDLETIVQDKKQLDKLVNQINDGKDQDLAKDLQSDRQEFYNIIKGIEQQKQMLESCDKVLSFQTIKNLKDTNKQNKNNKMKQTTDFQIKQQAIEYRQCDNNDYRVKDSHHYQQQNQYKTSHHNHNDHQNTNSNNYQVNTNSQSSIEGQTPYIKLIQELERELNTIKADVEAKSVLEQENKQLKTEVAQLRLQVYNLRVNSHNKQQNQNQSTGHNLPEKNLANNKIINKSQSEQQLNVIDQVSQSESSKIHMAESTYEQYQSSSKPRQEQIKQQVNSKVIIQNYKNQLYHYENSSNDNQNSNNDSHNILNQNNGLHNNQSQVTSNNNISQLQIVTIEPKQRQGVYLCNQSDTSLQQVNNQKKINQNQINIAESNTIDIKNSAQWNIKHQNEQEETYQIMTRQQKSNFNARDQIIQKRYCQQQIQIMTINHNYSLSISSISPIIAHIVQYIQNYEQSSFQQQQAVECQVQQALKSIKASILSQFNTDLNNSENKSLQNSATSNFSQLKSSQQSQKSQKSKKQSQKQKFSHPLIILSQQIQNLYECIRYRLKLLKKLQSQKYLKIQNQEQQINILQTQINKKDQAILSLRQKINNLVQQKQQSQLKNHEEIGELVNILQQNKTHQKELEQKISLLEKQLLNYKQNQDKLASKQALLNEKLILLAQEQQEQQAIENQSSSPIKQIPTSPSTGKQKQMNQQIVILRDENYQLRIQLQQSHYQILRIKNELSANSELSEQSVRQNIMRRSRSGSILKNPMSKSGTSIQIKQPQSQIDTLEFLKQILSQIQTIQSSISNIQNEMQKARANLINFYSNSHNINSQNFNSNSSSNASDNTKIAISESHIEDIAKLQQKIEQNDKIMKEYKENFTKEYTKLINEILVMEKNEVISKDKFRRCIQKLQEVVVSSENPVKGQGTMIENKQELRQQQKLQNLQPQQALLKQPIVAEISPRQLFKDIMNQLQAIVQTKNKHNQQIIQKLSPLTNYKQQKHQTSQQQILQFSTSSQYIDIKNILNQSWVTSPIYSNSYLSDKDDMQIQEEQQQEDEDDHNQNNMGSKIVENKIQLEGDRDNGDETKNISNRQCQIENNKKGQMEDEMDIRMDPNISGEIDSKDVQQTQINV